MTGHTRCQQTALLATCVTSKAADRRQYQMLEGGLQRQAQLLLQFWVLPIEKFTHDIQALLSLFAT